MSLRVRAALLLCAASLLLLLLWRNEQASAVENTFFYADDNGDSDLLATEAGDAFSEVSQQKQEQPAPVVQSVCALAEFDPRARRLNMTIFVFAWRRLASVQRLLDSLQAAEYCGHQIPLTIFVDGGASEEEEGEREAAVGDAVEEEAGLDPTATAAKTTFAADAAFLQYLVITFCARA